MNESERLLKKSMGQTTECQNIAKQFHNICEILFEEVERLRQENNELKQKLIENR